MYPLYLKYILPFLIPAVLLAMPLSVFHIETFTLVEQRVMCIFVLAALCWVLEPIPIYATSLLVILLELLTISTKGLWFTKIASPHLGKLLDYRDIIGTFSSPIIMLFLGGFFLALASTKYRLDINLARVLLKPFGKEPKFVMLGLMLITAVFSMFMSNTATTAMMLSILTPFLALFAAKDPGKVGFSLAVPIAANIGGIATPIGTPPNAIALKYLVGENQINFGQWMMFGVPFVIILLLIAWVLLCKLFPSGIKKIELNLEGKFLKTSKAIVVYVVFVVTILLWLLGGIHGMNAYVVALIPVTVFSIFKIITKEDLKKISWDVLWLMSGGIALGLALDESGLAKSIIDTIPFATLNPLLVISCAALLCWVMANFMSHTAAANLLLPIVASLGVSMHSLLPYGGEVVLILAVTFAASLGMSLPISTPPNALAFVSGNIETKQMMKMGIILGVVGLLLTFAMLYILNYFSLAI